MILLLIDTDNVYWLLSQQLVVEKPLTRPLLLKPTAAPMTSQANANWRGVPSPSWIYIEEAKWP